MRPSIPFRMTMGLLLAGVVGVCLIWLPTRDYLTLLLHWAGDLGPWGPLLLVTVYVVACLFLLPGSLLTLGAGFLFGVVWGTVAASLGSTLGATAAFLAGRTLARRRVEQKVAGYPKFQAVDRAVKEQGFKIVLLMRLSPLFPFNVLNYALGLTSVKLRDYVLASWIGMFPATLMYVYLGSAAKSVADLALGQSETGAAQQALLGVGLVATILVTVLVTRVAKRALDEAVSSENGRETPVAGEMND
ncbi:MAG: TVP38/TMEM64 family protein [Planctomycetes bacterium]|nr:TVP38/TMEM64 family protein [Planctomycetota bacterium]